MAQKPVTAPTPRVNVELTTQEIDFIKRALDLAAGTCATQPDGCVIGASRAALYNDLTPHPVQVKKW